MIISQVRHLKLAPNPLSMVVVAFTNSRQTEFAVECFDWEEIVLFELPPIAHVFVGINFLSKQQSGLFVRTTDSAITEDRVNF